MKALFSFRRIVFVLWPALFLLTSCAESLPELPESLPEEKAALITAVLDPSQKDISQAVVKAGNPNFIDERGITPLEYAVISSNTDKIKALLQSGADPLFPDAHGFSAVHSAASNPDTAPLECLLAHGVSPDVIGPEGKTPIMEALRLGNADSVRLLLEKKADLKKTDEHGRVPLCFAAMARVRSLELVKLLLEHGADRAVYDKDGKTPLFHAIDCGNVDTALYLLSLLPDFNTGEATDLIGFLAMKHAVKARNIFLAGRILEKKLEINTKLSIIYKTMAVVDVEGIHKLLARNNIIDDGKNALFWAAEADDPEMIRFLLDHGADPLSSDNAGNRPLKYARRYESIRILRKSERAAEEAKKSASGK